MGFVLRVWLAVITFNFIIAAVIGAAALGASTAYVMIARKQVPAGFSTRVIFGEVSATRVRLGSPNTD